MKGLMPATTTATELQRNYKKVVKKAKKTKEPVVVLSNNEPVGVYLDYETFKKDFERKSVKTKTKGKKSGLDEVFGSWTKKEAEEFNKRIDDMFENIDEEMWE